MEKLPITLIVLTYNEEIHLSRCLKNAKPWVREIIVVDSGSTDGTRSIAGDFGAKVHEHEFKNQAQQFNWALDSVPIKNDWILRLDADEYMTEELWREIAEILKATPATISGYYMKRRVYFMDRWIKHGGYYPSWFLRLFRKGHGRYEDREMDEHLILLQGTVAKLENDFVDRNLKGLYEWTARHNNYSTRETSARMAETNKGQASQLRSRQATSNLHGGVQAKRKLKTGIYYKLPLFLRALIYFKYRYFIRLGFLDGIPGLIYHTLQGFWHQFLIDAKMYEARRNKDRS